MWWARRRAELGGLAGVVWVAAIALACGSPAEPEARLRLLLEQSEQSLEARDLGDVKDAISERYRDNAGHDKRELVRYLAGIVLRNQKIHIATRIRELTVDEAGTGRVTMVAGLASGPVSSVADLTRLRANVYRFDFAFVEEDGEWRLEGATWQPASTDDLLP